MPTLMAPLALIGLASLPALAAIYYLRNRYRRQTVSSLMLWEHLTQAREGGMRMQRLQTPLLFLLELLALSMLTLAATGPRAMISTTRLPLVVVLDDSYSMQAAGTKKATAREEAIDAIHDEYDRGRYNVRFVLAGAEPQMLGDAVSDRAAMDRLLEQWRCAAPRADIDRAVALASELGGTVGRVLVLTDHAPIEAPKGGKVQWWAFGRERPNVAFVSASRSSDLDAPRCLFEIVNRGDAKAHVPLRIDMVGDDKQRHAVHASTIDLDAGQTKSVFIDIKPDMPTLVATLGANDLAIDNEVTLLPANQRVVRVGLAINDAKLRGRVERAIAASPQALMTTSGVQLLITDHTVPQTGAWTLQIDAESDAAAYVGPFVIDRVHPLAEGLSLAGMIWAAGKSENLPGRPIIMAGNVPLLSDVEFPTGRHELHLRLRADLSTIVDSPNWPILFWNLVAWRGEHVPGLERTNLRLGEDAAWTTDAITQDVKLTDPDGKTRTIPLAGDRVTIPTRLPGVYTIESPRGMERFVVNVLDRDESDLSHRHADRLGDWAEAPTLRWDYQSVAWVFGLIAAGLLTGHLYLVGRSARQGSLS